MSFQVWMILATLLGIRISSGIQTQSVGAVGPALVEALDLTYVALGTLIGAYSLPGVAASLPGGWLIARIGDRRMVLIGLAMTVAGSATMAIAFGYPMLMFGRVLSGVGAALLAVVGTKIMLDQVPQARVGGLMGTYIAGYPLGLALALSIMPMASSWRAAMSATAVICAVVLIAAWATIPPPSSTTAATTRFRLEPGSGVPLLLISLVWALYNGGCVIMFSFVPPFLVAQGMSKSDAGAVTSLSLYATIPVMPFGGWLLARSTGTLPGIILSLAAIAAIPLLLPTMIPAAVLMTALGVLFGLNSGPIFTIAGSGLKPEERAVAMGILFTTMHTAMAVAPALGGLARDVSGDPMAPFYVAVAFFVATVLVHAVHTFYFRRAPAVVS